MQCYILQYTYIILYILQVMLSIATFQLQSLPLPTFSICRHVTDGSHILLCIRYKIILAGSFDREGLHQLQNCVVADEDLRSRNVLLLASFSAT